ncbi:hypothetical protein MIZ03_3939 [Rhodoferax lithotrophicus]|uniref:DUF3987 domain-containing protein n=1 Tax=Rhodoferax lithotrophicus TaxID=2798804 RepID=A0ABM7MRU3_9BURK|nr:YfjI family protein [Rhodoferax sp. MIZ03]BCO29028.1 hypothetical protein MIZ03_3939 [Rhodoferax sp. MIZ03]
MAVIQGNQTLQARAPIPQPPHHQVLYTSGGVAVSSLPSPYPEDSLPPLLYKTVINLAHWVQATPQMIAPTAIAAAALACQRGYLVEGKPGRTTQLGLAVINLMEISDGKDTIFKILLKPISDHEEKTEANSVKDLAKWKAYMSAFKAKEKGLNRDISKLTMRGEDTSAKERELDALFTSGQEKPKEIRQILNDASIKGIYQFLRDFGNSCGVFKSEGAAFFKSNLAKFAAHLADLWSSGDVRFVDKNGKSYTIRHPRFSIVLMVQPSVLFDFLRNYGSYWQDTGLMGRILFNYPVSTRGYRNMDTQPEKMQEYNARILEILNSAPCAGTVENVTLKFEESARRELTNFATRIESHLRPGGLYSDVSDAASKTAENAARMAAVFHVFEGHEGDISLDMTQRAITICDWHLFEFKRLFGEYLHFAELEQDALDIEKCIRQFHNESGCSTPCPKNRVAKFATKAVRDNYDRREAAFQYLLQHGRIQYVNLPRDKTTYVIIPGLQYLEPISGVILQQAQQAYGALPSSLRVTAPPGTYPNF